MNHLTREQVRNLLATAKAAKERDWLLILVSYWHGLRASEAVSLTAANVRDGFLSVQRLKGSNKTVQPLVEHADPLYNEKAGLAAWLEGKSGDCPLFGITRQAFGLVVKKYCVAAGIPAHLSHPHVLKHSIATHSIRNAGIENVQAYLGHKSMASTGVYLRSDDATASAAVQNALVANAGAQ
jgi:integrase/recombinase XerD